MCFREQKNTRCVTHSGNSEENLRTAAAKNVAFAPGDFEVNCSMVISCRILNVNVYEHEGASKQIAGLDIAQYLFSLLFPSAKCCMCNI